MAVNWVMRVRVWWLVVRKWIVLCLVMGMFECTALFTSLNQSSMASSMSSRVGLGGRWGGCMELVKSSLNLSQSARLNAGLGGIGTGIGLVAIVMMMGKWSLVVRGPWETCML